MTTTSPGPILILGGTGEAVELARALSTKGTGVVMSFAGRTNPADLPSVPKRIGGFDGPEGLARELREGQYRLLVDATHPFADRMARHAEAAASLAGIPHLRLVRPPWQPLPGATWINVDDFDRAAQALGEIGARRAFLPIGSRHMGAFLDLPGMALLVRSIEPPSPLPPSHVTVVLARGPFSVDSELALLRRHRIDALVARNSGGRATEAKLQAAQQLDIPVVMVRRPDQPAGQRATTVIDALSWVEDRLASSESDH
jgi:precorrin-6A/cobalt-precorrin-6A reductase